MKEQSLPIVPWIGGKRRLAKHILPLFPAHTCYVEPGNDSNLLIVFYVQIMPDDFVMQLHRF